jgi:hypothetical protein
MVNIAPDCQYTQEDVTCSSNVPGMGLQGDLTNQANQTEECNSCSPIILYMWKRAFTMTLCTGDFRTKNSSTHNNSDSDILATVEKADIVELLDDDS